MFYGGCRFMLDAARLFHLARGCRRSQQLLNLLASHHCCCVGQGELYCNASCDSRQSNYQSSARSRQETMAAFSLRLHPLIDHSIVRPACNTIHPAATLTHTAITANHYTAHCCNDTCATPTPQYTSQQSTIGCESNIAVIAPRPRPVSNAAPLRRPSRPLPPRTPPRTPPPRTPLSPAACAARCVCSTRGSRRCRRTATQG